MGWCTKVFNTLLVSATSDFLSGLMVQKPGRVIQEYCLRLRIGQRVKLLVWQCGFQAEDRLWVLTDLLKTLQVQ